METKFMKPETSHFDVKRKKKLERLAKKSNLRAQILG